MSGLRTTLRILRDAPTNTLLSSPILQVASVNRLIVGAALASPRRSIEFFVDESCSSLTFFRLLTQEAPPEIPNLSLELSPRFQLLEPTATTTRLHTRASLRHCTFFELSSLGKTLHSLGIIDSWTANENNHFPQVVDRARLTIFDNLRDAIDPSIFQDDFDLRGWVIEDEEVAWNEGQVQPVTLAECKFGRPSTPFSTTKTNDERRTQLASSRRPAFTGGAGPSTSAPPPNPPKPTWKSALLGPETKTGAATPLSATKTAMATRSAPGMTTFTRTTETARKQPNKPNKPAQTATKPSTASKAPAKISGRASKSSTPRSARPGNLSLYSPCLTGSVVLVPPVKTATKGFTSTSTTPFNPCKRTQDEPPPAKKQCLTKPAQAPNAKASSSTASARPQTKPKAMAGKDDRGRWHRHYNDFPHVNKLSEVNPQPNYPNAQSLLLAKRNGIFANVDTDPAPELCRVEAMAAYTDRVVNGPYPWKCNQCNTSCKTCVFRGHAKKCDACASARNSCSILNNRLKFFFHQEDAAGRVALAPSHIASEAQRACRLRHEADLLIEHAACLHYEADIMTAHNTVAVLQILKMLPNDKKLVEEYRKTDDDVRDIFDNVGKYRKIFDIVVNKFPDLKDPRFSLPSDSQMKSPKKKKPAKAPTKKGKEKAVEPIEEEQLIL
ncbi:hypothetical protein K435DRAFT_867017 [Dendrothele bispora CBS 962.96]|uniref:Uncharacterized protein n=1 Tax=Dendrothele bispora (strain CBS 962.96) TaxID=1314807 RepID=A0A4S8LFC0_DENBC|nr:hypothetical protein K435DRAFT_867017 [Dendrothele bispora CBS 962.96]